MIKLLIAVLLLVIGANCSTFDDEKMLIWINNYRKEFAAKMLISNMQNVTISQKFQEIAAEICKKCPPEGSIGTGPGYTVGILKGPPLDTRENIQEAYKQSMNDPTTNELGACPTNCSAGEYNAVIIINSAIHIGNFLTFLMGFVMIFVGFE